MSALNPMSPAGTVSLEVTNSSGNVALSTAGPNAQVMITSAPGGAVAFVKFGSNSSVTATTSDTPILPGSIQVFSIGAATYVAGITGASTATLYFTSGIGE